MLSGIIILPVTTVLAHVVVKPAQVGVGAFQTFTVGVPNEKEQVVTGIKLVIPAGLKHVSPNVKPGWTIDIKKEGSGDEAVITELYWFGGTIPVGQRDEFLFSAQVPSTETNLKWKAYQSYKDGTVVAWDQESANTTDDDSSNAGPLSLTKVVNDLGKAPVQNQVVSEPKAQQLPLVFSMIAVAISTVALFRSQKK
jgi:uncharacterized protein YcnI